MQACIQPSSIKGVINAPPSKSAMQRACALALLNKGETVIYNPGKSDDDRAALEVIQHLGAEVKNKGNKLGVQENIIVLSPGLKTRAIQATNINVGAIHCGESGLSVRMFTPIAALFSREIRIDGRGSLLNRPMELFDQLFPQLGVRVHSNQGKLPLLIKGPLMPKDITIDGSLSSQFLTGLLMAFAKAAKVPVTLSVTNLKSKPYIDLTLQMMKHFGYTIENEQYKKFHIRPQTESEKNLSYTVEGDWSGAAFFLVAGAIAGGITLKGMNLFSMQADRKILQALELAGVQITSKENEIIVSPARLNAFHFDATDCPDLFPPLAALAACCEGASVIEGLHRLIHKESNRALSLQHELGKMGVQLELIDDRMMITGGQIRGAKLHSHHDHRIAMACAVAALKAGSETVISDAEAINKSYPDFFVDLKMLGANVSLTAN